MPAESQEPEKPDNKFPKKTEIDEISPDSTNLKEAVIHSQVMPTEFLSGAVHPDKTIKPGDLKNTSSLGDPEQYAEYNINNSGKLPKKPFNETDTVSNLPDMIREKTVDPEDIKDSFVSEHVVHPDQLAEDSRQIEPNDLKNTVKLVYRDKD